MADLPESPNNSTSDLLAEASLIHDDGSEVEASRLQNTATPHTISHQAVGHNEKGNVINTVNGPVNIFSTPDGPVLTEKPAISFFTRLRQQLVQPQNMMGLAGVSLGFLMLVFLGFPRIALLINERGLNALGQGKAGQAESLFKWARRLNPRNPAIHYNLGVVYEDQRRLEDAEQAYRTAIAGDLPEAYNNLSRLLIQEEQYDDAVSLLQRAISLTQHQTVYPEDTYNFYKNLGWARLEKGQLEDAQDALSTALAIAQQEDAQAYIGNPASAHCLLAQVLEHPEHPASIEVALSHWQKCQELGKTTIVEEDNWLNLARERLDQASQGES